MNWRPLSQRFNDLPIVLAGPILRRVIPGKQEPEFEPSSVSVWLALKEATPIRLIVYGVYEGEEMFSSAPQTPITIGFGLHIICVTAKSTSAEKNLNSNYYYTYDVEIGIGQSKKKLADEVHIPLSYGTLDGPSFVLPNVDPNRLCLSQGS